MAFDFAWDFRATNSGVPDPSYAVFSTGGSTYVYPYTYTNGDGLSINAGFDVATDGTTGPEASHDARIAGSTYSNNAYTFTVDLSSGSAPGAGTYSVDLALGYQNASRPAENALLKDNATTVIDLTNGGTGYATASGEYVDATGALVTASTTWTGTQQTGVVFASTTVNLVVNAIADSNNVMIAHFRLTLQEAGATSTRRLSVRGA